MSDVSLTKLKQQNASESNWDDFHETSFFGQASTRTQRAGL